MEMHQSVDLSKYLFSSLNVSEWLAFIQIAISTAGALVLGSNSSLSWLLFTLSVGGLFLSVFLIEMLVTSLQISIRRKEVAIMRALGAKRSTLLRAFLQRIVVLTILGSLIGTVIGYCIASFSAECPLLSIETAGITLGVFFASSFGGGFTAARRLSHLEIGEVLRQ